jgi:hypothetical protein
VFFPIHPHTWNGMARQFSYGMHTSETEMKQNPLCHPTNNKCPSFYRNKYSDTKLPPIT